MHSMNKFVLLLLLMIVTTSATTALAEAHRIADDQTGWYWYTNRTAAQISAIVEETGTRIIDLEVTSTNPLRFTAAFVSNEGVYESGWWWYYGLNATQLADRISANNGRLIDIERYVDGNQERFAVVMVRNTGSQAKGWWYYYGISASQVSSFASSNSARLVDIESYTGSAGTVYAVIMIQNTGSDAAGWGWFHNTPVSTVSAWMNANNMRMLEFEVTDPSTQRIDAVLISKSFHTPRSWWWYYNVPYSQVGELASQAGSRITDIDSYLTSSGARRYNIVLLNNSNDLTVEIASILQWGNNGDTGLYLKEVGGSTLASLQPNRQFEPASTIKAIHNFHATREVMLGNSSLNDFLAYTDIYNGSCPDGPNVGFDQLGDLMTTMMTNSDNASTRAIADEFLPANIQATAQNVAGMTSTSLNHMLGCGGPAIANPNRLTLRDAGRLYEGVQDLSLLNEEYRDVFYSVMQNQNTASPWWQTNNLYELVDEEADALGIDDVSGFKSAMRFAWKPGGYTLNFGGSTHEYISVAGVVTLPDCTGRVGSKSYVFGVFVDNASTNPFARVDEAAKELFRALINEALPSCPSPVPDFAQVAEVSLLPNVPNPFNPRTNVMFELRSERSVMLTIHDIAGRQVAILASESFPAGRHSITWEGRDQNGQSVASGTYFARIVTGVDVQSRKLMLLR